MGYRHTPLSRRLGISFHVESYWRLDMAEAECFMHFIGGLRQLFGDADTLYMEGVNLDPEVEAFYRDLDQAGFPAVQRLIRHPRARFYQVQLTRQNHKILANFAATKTFAGLCDALLIHRDGKVLLDGTRIGERIALLSRELPESSIRKFAATKLKAACSRVGDF